MWKRPSEELPECEVGDMVIGIVNWRERPSGPIQPHVIILEALEYGWYQEGGYCIEDCEWWILEKELIKQAREEQ